MGRAAAKSTLDSGDIATHACTTSKLMTLEVVDVSCRDAQLNRRDIAIADIEGRGRVICATLCSTT